MSVDDVIGDVIGTVEALPSLPQKICRLLRITPCPLAHYPRALTDPYASRSGVRRATAIWKSCKS